MAKAYERIDFQLPTGRSGRGLKSPELVVAIDARIASEGSGGVRTVIQGLIRGLAALDGPEHFVLLVRRGEEEWLRPILGERMRFAYVAQGLGPNSVAKKALRYARAMSPMAGAAVDYRISGTDGTAERTGAGVIHFPVQRAFTTNLPSIYHPHDLQHRHLPEFFSAQEARGRDRMYSEYCRRASMVATASRWVQQDVCEAYRLAPEKVKVVTMAPVSDLAEKPASTIGISTVGADPFILYPAQTWPHKNHLTLLRALDIARRDSGQIIRLVCIGGLTDFASTVRRSIRQQDLSAQVELRGFVDDSVVRTLYQSARAVVIPTLYEAASFPMWEAFRAGVPVVASNVTSLPAQAGDAALIVDPNSPQDIADALVRIWTSDALRTDLVDKGARRVEPLSWEKTASVFRAQYRRLSGLDLCPEDRELITEAPQF